MQVTCGRARVLCGSGLLSQREAGYAHFPISLPTHAFSLTSRSRHASHRLLVAKPGQTDGGVSLIYTLQVSLCQSQGPLWWWPVVSRNAGCVHVSYVTRCPCTLPAVLGPPVLLLLLLWVISVFCWGCPAQVCHQCAWCMVWESGLVSCDSNQLEPRNDMTMKSVANMRQVV